MPRLEFSVIVNAPRDAVWAFYDDVATLPRITPRTTFVRLLSPAVPMRTGARFLLQVIQPPVFVPLRWDTRIVEHRPPEIFVDVQGDVGPFGYWHHEHRFEELPNGKTLVRDVVTYDPPYGTLGFLADELFIRRQLKALFAYRHRKTRELLEAGFSSANHEPQKHD